MATINKSRTGQFGDDFLKYYGLDYSSFIMPTSDASQNQIIINVPFSQWKFLAKQVQTFNNNSILLYTYFIPFDNWPSGIYQLNGNFGIFFQDENNNNLYQQKITHPLASGNSLLLNMASSIYFQSLDILVVASQIGKIEDNGDITSPIGFVLSSNEIIMPPYSIARFCKYGAGIYLTLINNVYEELTKTDHIIISLCQDIQYYQNINNTAVKCYPIRFVHSQLGIGTYMQLEHIRLSQYCTYSFNTYNCDGACGELYNIQSLPLYYCIDTSYKDLDWTDMIIYATPISQFPNNYQPQDDEELHIFTIIPNKFLSQINITILLTETLQLDLNGAMITTTVSIEDSDSGDNPPCFSIQGSLEHSQEEQDYTPRFSPIFILQGASDINNFSGHDIITHSNIESPHNTFNIYYHGQGSGNYTLLVIDYNDEASNPSPHMHINISETHARNTICLYKDSLLTLSDGTQKAMSDLNVKTDILLDKNKQPTKLKKIDTSISSIIKTQYYFDDGTIITITNKHRFYNIEQGFYQYLHLWNIGEHAQKIDGSTPALIAVKTIEEECICYGIWTESGTYWVDNLLSAETQANEECMEEATPAQVVNIMTSMTPSALLRGINK